VFCRSLFVFSGVRVARSLVFCVVFCRSLFVFSEVRVARSLVFCVVFCRSLFVFSEVRVARSLVFCVVFCRSLFVLVVLVIVLSVLRFTAFDYPIWYLQTFRMHFLFYAFDIFSCRQFKLHQLKVLSK
jgi:hypothetical protein